MLKKNDPLHPEVLFLDKYIYVNICAWLLIKLYEDDTLQNIYLLEGCKEEKVSAYNSLKQENPIVIVPYIYIGHDPFQHKWYPILTSYQSYEIWKVIVLVLIPKETEIRVPGKQLSLFERAL